MNATIARTHNRLLDALESFCVRLAEAVQDFAGRREAHPHYRLTSDLETRYIPTGGEDAYDASVYKRVRDRETMRMSAALEANGMLNGGVRGEVVYLSGKERERFGAVGLLVDQ